MSTWFRTYGFADVADNLIIGAYPLDREDVEMLARLRLDRILNLVEDAEYAPGQHEAVLAALRENGIEEQRMQFTDYGGLSPEALELAVTEVSQWLDEGARVYVHCRAGWQRSAAVAAGVVALREGRGIEDALALVQTRKPSADPLLHQRDDLQRWWAGRTLAGPQS